MKLHRWLTLSFLCACMAVATGCGGSKANVHVEGDKTAGQELKDLDEAYQRGAINRAEYEKMRKRIIDGK